MITFPLNPLKEIRLRYYKTIAQIAAGAGVNKMSVIRSEQGTFSRIPEKILAYYFATFDYEDVADIEQQYRAWQTYTRTSNYGFLAVDPINLFPTTIHPFIWWRECSGIPNRVAISKAFCVHLSTMSRFEDTRNLPVGVPEQLIAALVESGYDQDLLDQLEDAYRKYVAFKRAEFVAA